MQPLTCVRCRRPMSAAFATVGEYAYGPKCAKIAGLLPNVSHAPKAPMRQPVTDSHQLALDLQHTCMPKPARKSHRYSLNGVDVLAMEDGHRVEVAEIVPLLLGSPNSVGPLWLGARHTANARDLVPQPMAYYHGQIPA